MPTLTQNEVHIWCESLNWSEQKIIDAYAQLPAQQQARADRFKVDTARNSMIVSATTTQRILSNYLDTKPEYLVGKHGKPFLSNSTIRFNLSHSQDYMVLAVSNHEVGVDIQYCEISSDHLELAQRFFAEREYRQLQKLPASKQKLAFFRCWARKEAFIKLTGQGLAFGLDKFAVDLTDIQGNCLLEVYSQPELQTEYAIYPILMQLHNYQAAVAIQAPECKINYRYLG